jgi:hypothetical protein
MEVIDRLLATPSWAYQACYVYPTIAFISILFGIIGVVSMVMLPAATKKSVPIGMVISSSIIQMVVLAFFALMNFWICRGALATKEKFAVTCKSTDDCQGVMGLPQSSECQCGARGLCGGCVMRNNTIPQSSFDAQFAPGYVA